MAHPSCHSNRHSNTGCPELFRNFGLAQDGTTRHCLFLTQLPRQGATEQMNLRIWQQARAKSQGGGSRFHSTGTWGGQGRKVEVSQSSGQLKLLQGTCHQNVFRQHMSELRSFQHARTPLPVMNFTWGMHRQVFQSPFSEPCINTHPSCPTPSVPVALRSAAPMAPAAMRCCGYGSGNII